MRPVLVMSRLYEEQDYALIAVVPHTTSLRGSVFEVDLRVPRLRRGAFNVQGLMAVPASKFIRRIVTLQPDQILSVEEAVANWLGMEKG